MKGCLMIQGTSSHVGKSIMTAALLRILKQDGFKVAPFKAQNMALNSYVTYDGLEMGRAQAMQAEAAGVRPDVRMNPILLKPTSDSGSQVIVMGKVMSDMDAKRYEGYKTRVRELLYETFIELKSEYDYVILEGAGSPAEINLMENDIVNMGMARLIDCPVLLVGDIDRGGVFASFVGTLELLPAKDRERIKGFIINKFRGDYEILRPGLDMLRDITGLPTIGVVPYMNLRIDEEDTPSEHNISRGGDVDIAVIYLPHISNFTDFDPLLYYPGVNLRYVKSVEELGRPDLVVIPGSKNTIGDLNALKNSGIAERIVELYNEGACVIGICGGYQMMGRRISDPLGLESGEDAEGLGIFGLETIFEPGKLTINSRDYITEERGLTAGLNGVEVTGYEIHMGRTPPKDEYTVSQNGLIAVDFSGRALGTYLHGIFENHRFTLGVINNIRRYKGLKPVDVEVDYIAKKEEEYNRLAEMVRASIDMNTVYDLLNG
ncbi:cobyric acid synthase [Calorimonas adulescens]|uniref:Cobyric acid synthase n=1 Tax=Calorimonas adulescens TaxID=2606906 RepID=A0A5D8QBJ7_9THEO|nr:cobyric acid synthase [Calorimonas adulescens]TZE80903.1 cobyric acid synthase [Calorimonas adulescens]